MYERFRQTFSADSIITKKEIYKAFPEFDNKNLVRWQKKGYLIKLRNKHYLLSEKKVSETLLFQIANKLYDPSYVSLETAFSFYNLIPEGVFMIQSISTRKTNRFENAVGTFSYHNLKNQLFFGYHLLQSGEMTFKMATLEKAILDFLYLRSDITDLNHIEALRWNSDVLKLINFNILNDYLNLYKSSTLSKKISTLKSYFYDSTP